MSLARCRVPSDLFPSIDCCLIENAPGRSGSNAAGRMINMASRNTLGTAVCRGRLGNETIVLDDLSAIVTDRREPAISVVSRPFAGAAGRAIRPSRPVHDDTSRKHDGSEVGRPRPHRHETPLPTSNNAGNDKPVESIKTSPGSDPLPALTSIPWQACPGPPEVRNSRASSRSHDCIGAGGVLSPQACAFPPVPPSRRHRPE